MKRYSFIYMTLVVVTILFTACNQDNIKTTYDDGGTPKVAFASTVLNKSMIPDDGNEILVPIYRTNTTGTSPEVGISLKTTTTNATGLFTLPDSVITFEDGSAVAYAKIQYSSINSLSPTASYGMTLTIKDSTLLSPTKKNIITIKAARQLTFEYYGEGTFTSEFFEDTWSQPIEKAVEGEVYKMLDCYTTGYPIIFSVNDDGTVSFTSQNTGYLYSASYGYIYINQSSAATSTKVGNTVTLQANFSLPNISYTWSLATETLQMPSK